MRSDCPCLSFPKLPATLEAIAAAKNITWGRCHYKSQITGSSIKCPDHPNRRRRVKNLPVAVWHLPISPELEKGSTWNPYTKLSDSNFFTTVFIVVRNPYARAVSEISYQVGGRYLDRGGLNKKISSQLSAIIDGQKEDSLALEMTQSALYSKNPMYYKWDGHWIPQHRYLDVNLSLPNIDPDVRVLKFENLGYEFQNLAKEFGYNLSLPPKNHISSLKNYGKDLSMNDLTNETKSLIFQYFQKDFDFFSYEK